VEEIDDFKKFFVMKSIHVELLDYSFELADRPKRVVSLVSSATEVMDKMGLIDRVVGVSEYCPRCVRGVDDFVVGKYVNCDVEALQALEPDLVLITSGVQLHLGKRLAKLGFPVYVLMLPQSFYGMLENQVVLGGLLGELERARELSDQMVMRAQALRNANSGKKCPTVYVELWLGRHMRAVGGMTFARDVVEMAGGEMVFSDESKSYFKPGFDEVRELDPDVFLFFHEPEYEVNPNTLVRDRGWNEQTPILVSTVKCGQNMIHDGPSLLDSAEWLAGELKRVTQ